MQPRRATCNRSLVTRLSRDRDNITEKYHQAEHGFVHGYGRVAKA